MNKPTDEALRLSYEIADEYLPDVNILGIDGPNTGLADEIINKVLDAAVENIDKAGLPVGEKIYAKAAINKLRPGQ